MKTDRLGRLRYTPEQKISMVEAYMTSGMSAPRFAALHGVNYQTLVSWLKKNKPAASVMRDAPAALFSLIPAEITHDISPTSQALEVQLPSGAKLFISSQNQATLAAALMRELNLTSPC